MYPIIIAVIIAAAIVAFALVSHLKIKTPKADKKLNLDGMKLVFEDNFDGELDALVWDTTSKSEIRRGGYWAPEQCFTRDGKLVIRTEYKENGRYGKGWYTGTCRTRNLREFKYGYFEARCKIPPAEGLWSAFWLYCDSMVMGSPENRNGAEIDVMESPYFNDPKMRPKKYRNTTMHTLHINGYEKEHKSKCSGSYKVQTDMYNSFNTYGVLWTENEYVFYINGQETWRTDWGVSHIPEFLWLSVEIAGEADSADPSNPNNKYTWSGEITNNASDKFPMDFEVDYVRVYQSK